MFSAFFLDIFSIPLFKYDYFDYFSVWKVRQDVIYQTRKTVFGHIRKHPEEGWKYKVKQMIFEGLWGVWKCGLLCLEYLIYLLNWN